MRTGDKLYVLGDSCARFLRSEDRQVPFLVGQYVIHEELGQVSEATPGTGPRAVERIAGLSILESLNRYSYPSCALRLSWSQHKILSR